jgi:sensor histidine kinase regulating citrate/malate metabolism
MQNSNIEIVIDSVLSLFFEKIKTLGIQIYKIIDKDILIQNRSLILCQSLVPIIENALESIATNPFKPSEGPWLRIQSEVTQGFLILTVVNSGDPVSGDHWSSHLNLAFSEVEGLGKNQNLFLVKRLVENLGGEFSFLKFENHGAFRWTLPIGLFEGKTHYKKKKMIW